MTSRQRSVCHSTHTSSCFLRAISCQPVDISACIVQLVSPQKVFPPSPVLHWL
jgi:hypothetical protein